MQKIVKFFCILVALALSTNAEVFTTLNKVTTLREKISDVVPDGLKNGLASGLATAVVKIALQPFDTIKSMQQMNVENINAIQTAVSLVKNRGILSLWSGIGISAFGSSPSVAIYFSVFSSTKKHLSATFDDKYHIAAVAIAAMVGNTIASVFRVPYEVLKHRLQAGRHTNLLEAVRYICVKEGVLGMFGNGKLVSQLYRDVPYAMITAVSYEILQYILTKQLAKQKLADIDTIRDEKTHRTIQSQAGRKQISNDAICGSIAGGLGSLLTTPMDVIKTRLMSDISKSAGSMAGVKSYHYASVGEAITRIIKEEGVGTFFRGVNSRLIHKIPANGLFFLCYEEFRSFLGVVEDYERRKK